MVGLLTPADMIAVGRETGSVLLFLLGMMIISIVLEQAGVFRWAAYYAVQASWGVGQRLLIDVFLLGAIVTALLSLDVTVIILTPVIHAAVATLGSDPLPYLYACAFVVNTGSLVFPTSNLTNLIITDRLGVPFSLFTLEMALPNAAAVVANILVFLWLFRDQLRDRLPQVARPDAGALQASFRGALIVAGLALAGIFLSGLAGRPLWPVALAGATVAVVVAVSARAGTVQGIGFHGAYLVHAPPAITPASV